ncbi:hypothetical protein [Novosphingobium sp. M1R2S20]|uniref:Uncharacterized protein n=1 Tax=Novosphingobium rhizovicinum TaxID=3228928 RepID=A0ABV3RFU7_9SPHN
MADRDDHGLPKRDRKVWLLPAILIALLIILAVYGLAGGLGEAVGVEEAAPGDTNASTNPASEVGD